MKRLEVLEQFEEVFGYSADQAYFSPGRINLIGEHTDYNGGRVLPAAITLGTYGAASRRQDQLLRFYSENFADQGIIEVSLDDLSYKVEDGWTNYAKGVLHFLQEEGHTISSGMDVYVHGTIPNGSGLSSSSSLELLIGVIAEDLYNLEISRLDLVKIGKRTENDFIGVQSGIMDQFAIGMGARKSAIYLDTNTLDYELVPVDLKDNVIIIMNTKKRRELVDSKYNERRSECELALAELQKELPIQSLGELDFWTFDEYAYLIKDADRLKRARHAVLENLRTLKASKVLKNGELEEFGHLMNASHISLEHDYEVTGFELDTLVHTAWKQEGVLGARMTGAGFGGCAIALVKKDRVEAVQEAIYREYLEAVGYEPEFYSAEIASGSQILE